MRTFNVKILFHQDKTVKEIAFGDFGETDIKGPRVDKCKPEDCVLSWPVNPNFTGAKNILAMLGLDYRQDVKITGEGNIL